MPVVQSVGVQDVRGVYTPGTTVSVYEIYWTNSKIYFVVGNDILHTFSASTAPWCNTMNHYLYMDNVNSGNTSAVNLYCRNAAISRLGPLQSQPASYYQSGTTAGQILKYGAGNLHQLNISGITNGSIVTLYDNTSATGTIIYSSGTMSIIVNQSNNLPISLDFKGAPFFNGLTLVISGANSNATVIYE